MTHLRILPPALFVICVAVMVALDHFWPGTALRWQSPYHAAPLLLLLAGLSLSFWGSHHFGRIGTNIHTFKDPGTLVTNGPFRFSRNPMYLGMALALFGVAKLTGSASPMLVVIAFVVITDRWYIRFEEARMKDTFGDSYDAYCAHTRRWI